MILNSNTRLVLENLLIQELDAAQQLFTTISSVNRYCVFSFFSSFSLTVVFI